MKKLIILIIAAFLPLVSGITARADEVICSEGSPFCIFSQLSGMAAGALAPPPAGTTTEFEPGHLYTEDLGNGVVLELVWIPPGEFMMGSATGDEDEKPMHKVRISRGFYLGRYEVLQDQWKAVMGFNPGNFRTPTRPVERISWHDCQTFVRKLSDMTGHVYRLPTEAEWEYSCRAGSTTDYSFGDNPGLLKNHAWYMDNSGLKPQPAGVKTPNAWGLYDMHGNAWEWCQDWYGRDYYGNSPKEDPQGPAAGRDRIIRGGGWLVKPGDCRSAKRARFNPVNGINYNTCRVLLEIEQ